MEHTTGPIPEDPVGGRLEELDVDTAIRLLAEHHVGRVAFNDEGGPLVFPVNYVFDRGTVVFRSDADSKWRAAAERQVVSFQIDHVDEIRQVGWSVLVRGRLTEVVDPTELARLDAIDLHPFVGGEGKHHHLRVVPRVITGRRIPLPGVPADGWYAAAVEGTTAFRRGRE